MGVGVSTYRNHENSTGGRGIPREALFRYASFFGVTAEWILTGRGEKPTRASGIPVMGKVGAGAFFEPVQDGGWADAIDRMELPDPEFLAIVIVKGDSQLPRYRDGEAILYDTRPLPPDELIGQYAVCDLIDGRRLIKIIRQADGVYWLESHNAEPEIGVQFETCYPVVGTLVGNASPFVKRGAKPKRDQIKARKTPVDLDLMIGDEPASSKSRTS
jgi:SOS-response transcriptional repressor LexA